MTTAPHAEHHLLDHLLAFGRLLRQFGVAINPGQMLDLLAALEHVEIGRREDVYLTCRTILIRRREDLPLFDEAWQFFWASQRQGQPGGIALPDNRVQEVLIPRRLQRDRPDRARDKERPAEEQQEIEVQMSYSRSEQLRQKDFAQFTGDEMDQARLLIAQIAYRMAERPVRRWTSGKGRRIDTRRTLRQTLHSGGEALTLWHKTRRLKQRPLVVLCDISGSMDRYSRILLQFVHTISAGLRDVETFVFGTRLTRITRMLEHKDIDEAVREVGSAVQDWNGGTRIGDAIKEFNFKWGRRVLGRGAIVLLISDGWDRGDPELLGHEIARLQRTSYRLIWLNPLLGMPGYQPLTRGLQAALPHVDDFLPVHNLQSLEQLGAKLAETLRR
ncbi:MAG: VWA domain-containing protein [Chloroflexi bacterium]|nr:VWA domain-containing protein [Chloroflexota bacterium]